MAEWGIFMIRLFGGMLVFCVFAYSGFYLSGRLKARRDFLRAMSGALSFIATEIEYSHYDLINIFRRADSSPRLNGFFTRCADGIEQYGIRKIWDKEVGECVDSGLLKDTEVLRELGRQLGMSDIEGQKKAIGRVVLSLDEDTKRADEEYLRLSKPYKSCGILLGVFFLIIIA